METAVMPVNRNNGQHGMLTLRVQPWHEYRGGNQKLSNPVQQEGNHSWSWKPHQLIRVSEVMDFGGEPTTASLLKQHSP